MLFSAVVNFESLCVQPTLLAEAGPGEHTEKNTFAQSAITNPIS